MSIIHQVSDLVNRIRYRIPARPRQVQLEVTNACNLDCKMCPRELMDIELKHMEWTTFKALTEKLQNNEEITLTGWGEPFLHPKIFDMIACLKARGHKVRITSNGVFPAQVSTEKILASGLDSLTFSIDSLDGEMESGHTDSHAQKNIETLAKTRKNHNPYLRLQATLHANGEKSLEDIIRFAAKINADAVNIGRIDQKYDADLKRPGPAEERRIFKHINKLANSLNVQLDFLQYAISTGPERLAYRLLRRNLHKNGQYCLKTFDYTYITREGNVTPCCLLPEKKIGDALSSDIASIWQSESYNHFRENYRDTCGSCDLWSISQLGQAQS